MDACLSKLFGIKQTKRGGVNRRLALGADIPTSELFFKTDVETGVALMTHCAHVIKKQKSKENMYK
jgi:hypothetical protein